MEHGHKKTSTPSSSPAGMKSSTPTKWTNSPKRLSEIAMISLTTFLLALKESMNREPNKGQQEAIEAASGAPLFVVAGPGTGKTATLTMRMLKLIFVDGISPRGILATTFTNKAAEELRSRLLSWGYGVQEHLLGKEK